MAHTEGDSGAGALHRRIVTGVGEDGKAKILHDDCEGAVDSFPNGIRIQRVWWTDTVPVDVSPATNADLTKGPKNFQITNEGTIASVTWLPPGEGGGLHSTFTIDYGVILEGEMELTLDNGEKTILKQGDVIVQRGTNHAWRNPHPDKWAKVFFVCAASEEAIKAKE